MRGREKDRNLQSSIKGITEQIPNIWGHGKTGEYLGSQSVLSQSWYRQKKTSAVVFIQFFYLNF